MNNRVKWGIIALLILVCGAIIYWKIAVLGFHPARVIPTRGYTVHVDASVKGYGSAIQIETFLPKSYKVP